MVSRGRILVAMGLVVAVALGVLLVLLSRKELAQRARAEAATKDAGAALARPAPPQTAEARERYAAALLDAGAPAPALAPDEPAEPPPLSALILTFPDGTSEDVIAALYGKCGLVETRRSRRMARVRPEPGRGYDEARACLKWEDVQVSEERDPNAPR